ncbi:MAG: Zn-dependent hydrolase [candidate division KSB1 bacterium]|nr:Zn-dependent hydrolase [candidate division KSB1 bacterium]MDZ7368975.1 Zn-dependent hydrolase [candidate division KSB1 bacterium]
MREFSILICRAAITSLLFANAHVFAQPIQKLRVNAQRLEQRIMALAEFGKNPFGGVSRVAFSEADLQGRNYIMSLMREAGLTVRIDAAGNIIGRREGREPGLPSIIFGSHIDSVPNGGNYDGNVGSLGAIECAQVLHENGIVTRHPLEVVIFADEEGGLVGSRAMIGGLAAEALAVKSHSGKTIREGIRAIGGDPDKLSEAIRRRGDFRAYLELHIEQGGILDAEKINIGVVEGIVGINWWDVTIEGFANHAGTTPMDKRQDALLAAAQLIIAVNKAVTSVPGRQVGTVGRITAEPGAPNVIPGKVVMSLELRDLAPEKINLLFQSIQAEAKAIAHKTGTTIGFASIPTNSIPALTDERLRKLIAESARELGLSFKLMPSGAGHDAQEMARIAPAGMIFVPSVGGVSHSPKEFTKPEDMANGANVLLQTILKIDQDALD